MSDERGPKIKLAPEVIDAIARRVVELLPRGVVAPVELVDAAELARRLGVERTWVYTHAIQLGAIRLGKGRRPRLRFDPQVAIDRIKASARQGADHEPRRRPRRPRPADGERPRLLPIKGGGAGPCL
jgi:hypothetical protein